MIGAPELMKLGQALLPSLVSFAGDVIKQAGPAVGAYFKNLTHSIQPKAGLSVVDCVNGVITAANFAAQFLIGKPLDENPADIGYKAVLAKKQDGRKMEDFPTRDDYVQYLREEVHVDQEQMNKLSPVERVACAVAGTVIYIKQMEEKVGMILSPSLWGTMVDLKREKHVSDAFAPHVIAEMKSAGIKDGEILSEYFAGNPHVSFEEAQKVFHSLKEAMRQEYPDASEAELNRKVSELKD